MKMNELYLAWKERRGSKIEIWVKFKNDFNHSNQLIYYQNGKWKDRFSETEKFIELWQAEKSLWNILSRSSRSKMFFKISVF